MSIADRIEELIRPAVEAARMETVEVQYLSEGGRMVLRIFLDKEEGPVTLADCETMSGTIGDLLDNNDIIRESYVLEVSSPGIDRVLKKKKDFVRFKGRRVRVSVYAPIDKQRNFMGPLIEVTEDSIVIDDVTGKNVAIPFGAIARARLEPEI